MLHAYRATYVISQLRIILIPPVCGNINSFLVVEIFIDHVGGLSSGTTPCWASVYCGFSISFNVRNARSDNLLSFKIAGGEWSVLFWLQYSEQPICQLEEGMSQWISDGRRNNILCPASPSCCTQTHVRSVVMRIYLFFLSADPYKGQGFALFAPSHDLDIQVSQETPSLHNYYQWKGDSHKANLLPRLPENRKESTERVVNAADENPR